MDDATKLKRLNQQRWERELDRADRKRLKRKQKAKPDRTVPSTYRSRVLDLFGTPFLPFKSRLRTVPGKFEFPKVFSLTTNGEQTLEAIQEIVSYARTSRLPRLTLDHRSVQDLGLGADALLAVVLKEITMECAGLAGAYIRGYKPSNKQVQTLMDNVGSVRVLGAGVDDIKVNLRSKATVFRHQNRGKDLKVDAFTADPISQITADFSDHLDECLSLSGRRLSVKGRGNLLSYVAEVLNNAQEHSGTAQWVIVGFVDDEDHSLVYRAAIFSLGKTIAQTFVDLDSSSISWQVVAPYLDRHRKAGFFGAEWTEADLLTVVSLQGHISSKLEQSIDRGQGTVDLIQFFQDMSLECAGKGAKPMMSIISGNTHISFDGKYRMEHNDVLRKKIIAFNQANDLAEPPDKAVVTRMKKVLFPGVMISLAVPLAGSTVEAIPEESAHED